MSELEPMDVHYETNSSGAVWPVPALEQGWSNADKLRWLASLVEHKTGVRCRIDDGHSTEGPGYKRSFPELFGLHIDRTSSSSNYDDAWIELNGVEMGAMAVRRSLGLEAANLPIVGEGP